MTFRSALYLLLCLFPTFAFAQVKQLNPDISLNGLLHYQSSTEGNTTTGEYQNGLHIKEVELRFTSNIDAYSKADVTLALEKHAPEAEGEEAEYHIEPEEAFIESLRIPAVSIKVGKYLQPWGKHNELHTHAFYFIDAPYSQTALFGDHGLAEIGLGTYYLAPTPWFFEISGHVLQADNEHIFGTNTQGDVAGVLNLKNLWDLSDSTTLEWTASYANGRNTELKRNHLYNSSVTLKNRPIKNSRQRSYSATFEYSSAQAVVDEDGASQGRTDAWSAWAMMQWSQHWWAQARYEQLKYTDQDTEALDKTSALIAYVPTEYSAIRLQYDTIEQANNADNEQRFTLQYNFTIGAHPAHAY